MAPGWGDRLLAWLSEVYRGWYTTLRDHPELLEFNPILKVVYTLLPEEKPKNIPLFDVLLGMPGITPDVVESINQVRDYAQRTSLPVNELVAVLCLPFMVQAYISAGAAAAAFPMAREVRPSRPDPATAWRALFTGGADRNMVEEALRDLGWNEGWIDALEEANRIHTDPNAAMDLYRRGEVDQVGFWERLAKQGFSPEAMTDLDSLKDLIPSPGDLITMAVREAWRDDVAAQYGLDQDYVGDFGYWMQKQGFSEEWSRRWWRAHWRLPGLAQAQEMLWRTDMNLDQFREFLRFSDIPATWRRWMGEIAYRTLTRVDIRRMHATGALNDDDLLIEYQNFGYNLQNATRMQQFTIDYNMEADRELTKGEILKGYRKGALSHGEARGALVDMNYSGATADYYLALEDYAVAEVLADEEIALVQPLYIAGSMNKSEATARLAGVGLTSGRINRLMEVWDVRRRSKTRRPSKADLERFVKQDVIGGPAYQDEMGKHGYDAAYVQWFYASLVVEMEDTARKEEERAAKEAERIQAAEEKTDYQVAKAELDFQVAQERLHMQQVRTAITLYARREEVDELMATVEELERDIAVIEVQIAGKRTQIQEAKATIRQLGVGPDLAELYDLIDSLNVQIAERELVIADFRVAIAEGQASIRIARLPPAITELTDIVVTSRTQIAVEQNAIADLRVTIAEAQQEIQQLGIPEAVLGLYTMVDLAQVEIATQRAMIADLRVGLAQAQTQTRWEEPSDAVEAQRSLMDALQIDLREEQEDIAVLKLEIAEIKAQVERMLSSEEIADLEASMEESRVRLRELEVERARLRL